MIEPNHFAIPPWTETEHWSQAVRSLEYVGAKRLAELAQAQKLAGQIAKKLRAVDDGLDALCNATCSNCIDICCKKATVWYDFKDLLYLYLSSGRLPDGQIYRITDLGCAHLTPAGCDLPRTLRPFICSWYLCPSQVALCSGNRLEGWHGIQTSVEDIQGLRKQLESEFIQAVR